MIYKKANFKLAIYSQVKSENMHNIDYNHRYNEYLILRVEIELNSTRTQFLIIELDIICKIAVTARL